MPNEMPREEVDKLEWLIDCYGLTEVLSKLSYICGEKATHVAENHQDIKTAKTWNWVSGFLDRASAAAEVKGV